MVRGVAGFFEDPIGPKDGGNLKGIWLGIGMIVMHSIWSKVRKW
jgi:hypothetical protein